MLQSLRGCLKSKRGRPIYGIGWVCDNKTISNDFAACVCLNCDLGGFGGLTVIAGEPVLGCLIIWGRGVCVGRFRRLVGRMRRLGGLAGRRGR